MSKGIHNRIPIHYDLYFVYRVTEKKSHTLLAISENVEKCILSCVMRFFVSPLHFRAKGVIHIQFICNIQDYPKVNKSSFSISGTRWDCFTKRIGKTPEV